MKPQSDIPNPQFEIRWLIRRDIPLVLHIERESYEHPWVEADFLEALRQRNCIGLVAEQSHRIVGFMIYETHRCELEIVNLAVTELARRQRIGSGLIQYLKDRLSGQRRNELSTILSEESLAAQFFLKHQGFRATAVLRGYYDDQSDAYLMRYRLGGTPPVFLGHSRISKHLDLEV
jgi:ribosomal-protein-alanine N-acetyltransferase